MDLSWISAIAPGCLRARRRCGFVVGIFSVIVSDLLLEGDGVTTIARKEIAPLCARYDYVWRW